MSATSHCGTCGDEIAVDAVEGICPKCLLLQAMRDSVVPMPDEGVERGPAPLHGQVRRFGDYELQEEIACGGMGIVYRAHQISLNRTVALKMIVAGGWGSPVLIERFCLEAEAAASLDHPHIVPIYEIGEHEGQHYFTMKLIEGENLREAITQQAFTPQRAAELMSVVARAVHYAHQHGVLHRDLKPNNILLDREGQPYLTDFGLAKLTQGDRGLTLTDAAMGTPSYMAPEQASGGGKRMTIAADVYGLGAILYELLTGQPPFLAATPVETLRQVVDAEARPVRTLNPAVDRDLGTICLKCLEKDPVRRYRTAETLAEDLEHWRRGEPIMARPSGVVQRVRRWVRRNPLVAGFILLLVVSLVGISALLKTAIDQMREKTHLLQEKTHLLQIVQRDLESDLRELWYSENMTFVSINSTKLATLTGRRVSGPMKGKTIPLVVAAHANDGKPVEAAHSYAPLLLHLEEELSRRLGEPVEIEFRLFKHNRDARTAILKGEADILRMGAFSYILAKDDNPNLRPIARERVQGSKQGVIVVGANSKIQAVADLKGKAIAVGDITSTTSGFRAPLYLISCGLSKASLRAYVNHKRQGEALEAVCRGEYDAGITGLDKFELAEQRHVLRKLTEFPSSPAEWVARSGLDPGLARQIGQVFANVHDASIIRPLISEGVVGFELPTDAGLSLQGVLQPLEQFFGRDWPETFKKMDD